MKKLLCVVPVLILFAIISTPNARADSYAVTFTCIGPPTQPAEFCPESGIPPSAPDVSFSGPTLDVTNLHGSVYSVTLSAVDSPADTYTWQWSSLGSPFILQSGPQWVDTLFVTDATTGILNQVSLPGGSDVPFTDPAITADGSLTFSLVLFALVSAPNARADSYTPTFSCSYHPSSDFGCYYIGSVGLDYTAPDVSFPSPTVQVTVNNEAYDVTLSTGDTPTDSYAYQFGLFNGAGPQPLSEYGLLSIYDLTTGTKNSVTDYLGYGDVEPGIGGAGTLTFSPVSAATPEPAPVLLMLLGSGLIFLLRKRFVPPPARIA